MGNPILVFRPAGPCPLTLLADVPLDGQEGATEVADEEGPIEATEGAEGDYSQLKGDAGLDDLELIPAQDGGPEHEPGGTPGAGWFFCCV